MHTRPVFSESLLSKLLKNRKCFSALLIYLLLLPVSGFSSELILSNQEKLYLKKHPVIKVSNEMDWAPFDFVKNGVPKGYSVDLVRLLAKKAGIKIRFINGYSWYELVEQFDKRNIDLMHSMSKSAERVKKYHFSQAYMPWRLSYILRDNEQDINSPADFKGRKIAVGKGWSSTKVLKQRYPEAIFIDYETSLQMLQALSTAKVDIAIDNMLTTNYHATENIITNIKQGGFLDLHDADIESLHFASHKDTPELVSIFEKAYELITPQEKTSLQKHWFVDNNNKSRILFSKAENAYLEKKKIIRMCIDPDFAPFESFDESGQYVGITADFFKLFQQEIGIPIQPLKTTTWTESVQAAKNRQCDIFSLAMETENRKKYMNFTSPYLHLPLVMATRMDVAFIDNISHLENTRIGIVKDYAFNEIIRKKYPNIEVVDVENINEGLQKVVNGELFGFVETIATISYHIQRNFIGELKIAGKFPEKWSFSIGVRNDDPQLLSLFEKVIQATPSNTRQKIINKYISVRYEQKPDYKLLIMVLIGVTIVGLFGLYHYRKLSKINRQLHILKDSLQEQANRDPLTSLYNRRYFHNFANNMINLAHREKSPLSVIMLDIDDFKKINDSYGHAAGDITIKRTARLLMDFIRKSDITARIGGEEFVVLLPATDLVGTEKLACKLRELIAAETIRTSQGDSIQFTASLGVASLENTDTSIDTLLNKADKALYQAKHSGKNRVEIYKPAA